MVSAGDRSGVLLDIGGGTGGHAASWHGQDRFPVVIDPSAVMLARASQQSGIAIVQARSQSLPFADDIAQLAYFHLSIHYGNWRAAIAEANRVVSFGGRIEIWTMTHDAIERSSLGRWFPQIIEIDTARFPDPEAIAEYCRSHDAYVELSSSSEPIVRTARDWAAAVRARFVSTLQLLDDAEIDQGLARFGAEYPDPDSLYRYPLRLTRISIVVGPLR
jgi:ubiquinone/menaquinone biosynthesis C-methylase UbiE